MKQRRSLESHLNYLDMLLLVVGDPLWFLLEPLELLLLFAELLALDWLLDLVAVLIVVDLLLDDFLLVVTLAASLGLAAFLEDDFTSGALYDLVSVVAFLEDDFTSEVL